MRALKKLTLTGLAAALVLRAACKNKGPAKPSDIEYFPCNSMDKVVSTDLVSFDPSFSADGKGSLKVTVDRPTTVRLFEVAAPGATDAKYIYKAKVNLKDCLGDAYLQMVIHFPNGGEVNAYQNTTGQGPWVPMETFGIVGQGQKPDVVKLNLVIQGTGSVWVDDVHLVQAPQH
jgi:hypothetical protein